MIRVTRRVSSGVAFVVLIRGAFRISYVRLRRYWNKYKEGECLVFHSGRLALGDISRYCDLSMTSNQNPVRIAMRDKHYNERSEIQNAAMKAGLDLIPSFADSKKYPDGLFILAKSMLISGRRQFGSR